MLFPNIPGEPDLPLVLEAAVTARRPVAKAFSAAGQRIVPKVNISTQSMRKTRGYAMYQAGSSIEHISKALNHSSTAVTLRYIGITLM